MNISEKQVMEDRDPNIEHGEDFGVSNDREDKF